MKKLTDNQVLAAIIEHGLSVRRLPLQVVTYLPAKQNDQVFEPKIDKAVYASWYSELISVRRKVPEGVMLRKMHRYVRVPRMAGFWMCRPVDHLGGSVSWNQSETPPQRTLELAVRRTLEKLELQPPPVKRRAKATKPD